MEKSEIPVCRILGVNIAAIHMEWLLNYLIRHVKALSGKYITVANVHTTVMHMKAQSIVRSRIMLSWQFRTEVLWAP